MNAPLVIIDCKPIIFEAPGMQYLINEATVNQLNLTALKYSVLLGDYRSFTLYKHASFCLNTKFVKFSCTPSFVDLQYLSLI